jgi:hypothetical protein
MAKRTKKQRSLAAKKGWETRRANLRTIKRAGTNRRQVGKWYQKQLDAAVEREVKVALKKERAKNKADLKKLKKKLESAKDREIRKLKRRLKAQEKQEKLNEEIMKSPRRYIEQTIDKLWDKFGRDGEHREVKRVIAKLAERFSWPENDLWHWYFSPTWTSK